MQNIIPFGGLVFFFLVLSPALWLIKKKFQCPVLLKNGLWGIWTYSAVVSASLILGIIITILTNTLYITISLGIFAFPFGFSPSFGLCLLNGFDAYHPECDVFPGAYAKIFISNSCLYFLIGVLIGIFRREIKQRNGADRAVLGTSKLGSQ